MEEIARQDDASLVPGRGFTISPAIDADLRDRIRSLLISRNRQQPPRAPSSSPDFHNVPRSTEEHSSTNSPKLTRQFKFSPSQAIAKISRLELEISDMGATRFDGPAGQIEHDDAEVTPRSPSQPDMEDDGHSKPAWAWSRPTSGLDQRSQYAILGREILNPRSPDQAKSSAPKKSTGSRLPRFYLRTVPPATDVNKVARPPPQHIPGSYQSEVDAKGHLSPKVTSPLLDDVPDERENDVIAVPIYTGLTDEHGHNAIEALAELNKQDPHSDEPSSVPQSTPVNRPAHGTRLLQEHVYRPEDFSDTPVFVLGGDHEAEKSDNVDLHPTSAIPDSSAAQLARQRTSDLLAEDTPVETNTVRDVANNISITKLAEKHDKAPSSVNSVRSLHSIPMDADPVADTAASPSIPKSSNTLTSHYMEPAIADSENPLNRSNKTSPQGTQRPSPVSRAMSLLSEISARSGIPAPSMLVMRSINKRKSSGSANLTARPYHYRKRASQHLGHHRPGGKLKGKGYTPLGHKHSAKHLKETDSPGGTIILRQQENQGKSFTKAITDLEGLLKEALLIAGHAATGDHSEDISLTPHAQQRHYGRLESHASMCSSDCVSSLSGGVDEEDNSTTMPKHHAAWRHARARTEQPEIKTLYHDQFKEARDATPNPAQTRHSSTVPHAASDQPQLKDGGTQHEYLDLRRVSTATGHLTTKRLYPQPFSAADWAVIKVPSKISKVRLEMGPTPPTPQVPSTVQVPSKEQHAFLQRGHGVSESTVTRNSIRGYVNAHQRPPIEPRISSMGLRGQMARERTPKKTEMHHSDEDSDCTCVPYVADFKTSGLHYHPIFQEAYGGGHSQAPGRGPHPIQPPQESIELMSDPEKKQQREKSRQKDTGGNKDYSLDNRHHFSIREPRGFSLSRSHRRSPIARDWSTWRKRYVAIVTCITTAFMGLIIGIYAGEVPAIQYVLADEHHYTILGNVLLFLGLALTTALFYPLPLLHGRKPYTLAALAILLPLQFLQALVVNTSRSPYVATYRVGLLVPRIFAGIVMGFANISFITTLLDLFGASLQSGNPHQETVNINDVRRHGGGMGVWIGIYTFSAIGSIGIGFLIGAGIISGLDVSWGFWITIILNAAVLVLNILLPEVRRSAYRRSMAEVRTGSDVSRRVARGEIKMHLESTGPIWWWEEVIAGHVLAIRMLKQPGFVVLSFYLGWIYGQVVLVIVLLGALLSKYYYFRPQYVGLAVAIIPLGALLAIPFQKASLFSRARHHRQRTDSMTFEKRVTWTSHLVRRSTFMIVLPFADLAYTLASGGPPTRYIVPIVFAGLIGFLSNLAIAECYGIIMETYDTSDLQPGMTGRPRRVLPEEIRNKRTNFSCFPRVTAGFAIAQTFGFIIAAGVTAWGGVVERHVGAQAATAVMAGILLVLTLLLIGVLWRFKTVQIIPSERFGTNILSGPEDEWKPVIIGTPSGTTRRMSILELGGLSRWSEIRRRNKLTPERGN